MVRPIMNRSEMVNVYKKIMVGVDGSEHGKKALQEAVALAQAFKAELHVFHAIRHHYFLPLFPLALNTTFPTNEIYNRSADDIYNGLADDVYNGYSEEKMRELYEESGRLILEQAKQQVAAMKIPLEGKVVYNLETDLPPPEYVELYVKVNKIDLVVVGCAGHHSRARTAFLGTVATRILNIAPCKVLIVR
jgi:nucleotide-binding universal stress UspA family protein